MRDEKQKWHSYVQCYPVDHQAVTGMLLTHVNVEEKIDGDRLAVRVNHDALSVHPNHLGTDDPLIQHLQGQLYQLNPDWVYFLEYMPDPEQAIASYTRTPRMGAILMDVRTPEGWLDHEAKFQEAEKLGFECAPLLYQGHVVDPEQLAGFLLHESVLGGTMEGIVIKPVTAGPDGKTRYAKVQTVDFQCRRAFTRLAAMHEQLSPRDIDQMLRVAQHRQLNRVEPPSPDSLEYVEGDDKGNREEGL